MTPPRAQGGASRPHRSSRRSQSLGGHLLHRRLRLIRLGFLGATSLLVIQLVNLQVLSSSHLQALSAQQLARRITLPALRGAIYDRNGQTLAMSVPTKVVVADDFQIADPSAESLALQPLLGVPAATLQSKLDEPPSTPGRGYVVLTDDLSLTNAAKLEADQLPGITLFDSSLRSSPDGGLAASVIGSVDAAGLGSSGLEYEYEQLLAGAQGTEQVFESPYGVALPTSHLVVLKHPVPGASLELTLDAPLQFVTEQALARELLASNALDGTAIVMDTRTGQILSMANLVNVTQKDVVLPPPAATDIPTGVRGVCEAQNNLAVTQVYEPGSVFKIVPFSSALLNGIIKPTSTFSVPDYVVIDGHVFHDAEQHGLERLSATQILEYSSNIGTYEITSKLGESGLLAGVQRLGFGEPTGLNFPGESSGLLTTATTFSPTSLAALPIGQEDAVTPLQVLDAYNAIANGGVFVEPSLVRGTISDDGQIRPTAPAAARRVLPTTVATELTKMLEQVVSGGTGVLAAVPGYTVAGKTGTAQIPVPGGNAYLPGDYNATFVGFAPAQHPVLSMIVVLQRPTPDIYGGAVAAPVFENVMAYALHRYGVPATARIIPSGSLSQTSVLQDVT